MIPMSRATTEAEYQALAEFRFLIRRYLTNTEKAARAAGLKPQQYMGLLALRGLPPGRQPTVQALAERLRIRHHSAVELVDRLEKRGLLRRERSTQDRRRVFVKLTRRGERLLNRMVQQRIAELRESGPVLVQAMGAVIASALQRRSRRPARVAGKQRGRLRQSARHHRSRS